MADVSEKLYNAVKSIIAEWNEEGIYAVSFFVCSNEAYAYNGFSNVSSFAVSYNTEDDCKGAGQYDEERWNYAFWRQNELLVINPDIPNELTDLLFDWYKENGITNIGEEDEDCYDENCNYIGIAKAYREYVASRGKLFTLKDKIAKNAKAKEMIGCPIIPVWIAAHKSPESPYYNKEDPESNSSFVPFEKYEVVKY